VPLTRSLLSVGYPLILEATFEDERLHLQFDGIMKVDGTSAIGPFHYAPILFYTGQTKHGLAVIAVAIQKQQTLLTHVTSQAISGIAARTQCAPTTRHASNKRIMKKEGRSRSSKRPKSREKTPKMGCDSGGGAPPYI